MKELHQIAMNNFEAADKIHNIAMELSDLAKVERWFYNISRKLLPNKVALF